MLKFALPPLILEIADGDIAAQDTDAIVNAANNLSGWAPASPARSRRAAASRSSARRWRRVPIEPGGCVVTSGGRLAARHVIHAAVMGQDLVTSAVVHRTRHAQRAAAGRRAAAALDCVAGIRHGSRRVPDRRVRANHDRRRARLRTLRLQSLRLVRFVLFGAARVRRHSKRSRRESFPWPRLPKNA